MSKKNLLDGLPFTTIPDYFLATVMTELKESELRVMLYIYLHTLGYGKLADAISYDQFLNGVVTREGQRLDQGAGVSRRSLVTALASLEEKKLIHRQGNGSYATIIQLELPDEAEKPQVEKDKPQVKKKGLDLETKQALPVEEQVQIPAVEVQELPEQVQIFPEKQPGQVQKFHPSWNRNHENQNHENRVAAATVEVETKTIKLITDRIPGISTQEAGKLVRIAFSNNRDYGYVERLVLHVTTNPAIRKSAAVFITLIKRNLDRTPGPKTVTSFPGRNVSSARCQAGSSSKSSIDWSKFAPGGKYAFLAGSVSSA